jgi:DNA polymerase-4
MNNNTVTGNKLVMFIDMNSFFARCEQQVNYYLRNRPVVVCVYTGKHGAIIAASVEAKQRGISGIMRLDEAIRVCPDLVPLETNPQRYREFHIKIMKVLKKYSDDVIPKSIDEAIMDISNYRLIYKNPIELAIKIKEDIRNEVGDWLTCSIGIAPNAFLAKLGTELKKPDGLVMITPENIDGILKKLTLTDLPGIARGMSQRLINAGIDTPFKLRHTPPDKLKNAVKSIVGLYWHYRLNFQEVDQASSQYKAMQAMRQVSADQRKSTDTLQQLLHSLCMKLEQRMVKQEVYCREVLINVSYQNGSKWSDSIKSDKPLQDGAELVKNIRQRMDRFSKLHACEDIINKQVTAIGITVTHFIHSELINLNLFEDTIRQNNLRKTVYDIKNRFGADKVMKAAELHDEKILKDVIGFGSIKDFYVDGDLKENF